MGAWKLRLDKPINHEWNVRQNDRAPCCSAKNWAGRWFNSVAKVTMCVGYIYKRTLRATHVHVSIKQSTSSLCGNQVAWTLVNSSLRFGFRYVSLHVRTIATRHSVMQQEKQSPSCSFSCIKPVTLHQSMGFAVFVSAYRYIAITNLPIIPVFVEYLGQFLIDFNQIYRHSSVP